MNIAVIGTGNVGGALATSWASRGHHIFLGVRDTAQFKGHALLSNPNTSVHTVSEAISQAEVVLVATPPTVVQSIAFQLQNASNKVIIDATNAIRSKPEPYPTAYHAFIDLTTAHVVKCFNTTGFENMKDPDYGAFALDMFMAGDSDRAKTVARGLALDAGFENCYDFGGSNQVELLEQFALAWINLAIFQGMGRDIGLKLVKRR